MFSGLTDIAVKNPGFAYVFERCKRESAAVGKIRRIKKLTIKRDPCEVFRAFKFQTLVEECTVRTERFDSECIPP